jgi:hypothetical protein
MFGGRKDEAADSHTITYMNIPFVACKHTNVLDMTGPKFSTFNFFAVDTLKRSGYVSTA